MFHSSKESKCCINLGCRTAKLVIFNIDQSILESPIILNHWRLIHGINLSFQELNFSGGSQTKRSEVLFANLDHVQSQIVSHGEAWDYSPNLPIVKMNFLVSTTEKSTTCRPGSTNLVGLQKSNEKCVSDILFLLQWFPMYLLHVSGSKNRDHEVTTCC